jgi:hypothetical protein
MATSGCDNDICGRQRTQTNSNVYVKGFKRNKGECLRELAEFGKCLISPIDAQVRRISAEGHIIGIREEACDRNSSFLRGSMANQSADDACFVYLDIVQG